MTVGIALCTGDQVLKLDRAAAWKFQIALEMCAISANWFGWRSHAGTCFLVSGCKPMPNASAKSRAKSLSILPMMPVMAPAMMTALCVLVLCCVA